MVGCVSKADDILHYSYDYLQKLRMQNNISIFEHHHHNILSVFVRELPL